MIVCVCHRVNDRTLAQCARQGMSFDDVQLELGVDAPNAAHVATLGLSVAFAMLAAWWVLRR